jgi:NTP pyrophosphatase (non-canonical NTP hydrolase)
MSDSFNRLSPAEAERLACLSEECGEIIQAIGKVLRHGYEDVDPNDPHPNPGTGMGPNNRYKLAGEIGDLNEVCARMVDAGDINPEIIKSSSALKHKKLKRWTHHQPDSAYARTPA